MFFWNQVINPKEKTFLLSVNFLWWSDHHHVVLYYLINLKFRKCTSNKQVITDNIANDTSTEHFFWIFSLKHIPFKIMQNKSHVLR